MKCFFGLWIFKEPHHRMTCHLLDIELFHQNLGLTAMLSTSQAKMNSVNVQSPTYHSQRKGSHLQKCCWLEKPQSARKTHSNAINVIKSTAMFEIDFEIACFILFSLPRHISNHSLDIRFSGPEFWVPPHSFNLTCWWCCQHVLLELVAMSAFISSIIYLYFTNPSGAEMREIPILNYVLDPFGWRDVKRQHLHRQILFLLWQTWG